MTVWFHESLPEYRQIHKYSVVLTVRVVAHNYVSRDELFSCLDAWPVAGKVLLAVVVVVVAVVMVVVVVVVGKKLQHRYGTYEVKQDEVTHLPGRHCF